MGEVGIADQRADAHAAVGKILDAVETRKMSHVDESCRRANAALHQIQEIRTGGEIGAAGLGGGRDGVTHRCRPDIFEAFHATSFWPAAASALCAVSTAWVIP